MAHTISKMQGIETSYEFATTEAPDLLIKALNPSDLGQTVAEFGFDFDEDFSHYSNEGATTEGTYVPLSIAEVTEFRNAFYKVRK